MPTAAKLVAALAFALVAFLGAELMRPGFAPDMAWGWFGTICAALGALCGWGIAGGRAGAGALAAVGTGMRASVTIVVWALLGFSLREMILRSLDRHYDDPFEALVAALGLMIEYGQAIWVTWGTGAFRPDALVALLGGGALAGLVTEWAQRRWK